MQHHPRDSLFPPKASTATNHLAEHQKHHHHQGAHLVPTTITHFDPRRRWQQRDWYASSKGDLYAIVCGRIMKLRQLLGL